MLSSAMQVSWQRTLDTLRPAAACAEAVAMKVRNLVLSKKGGICCYSTQCGSADVSGYPFAEGQPAIRPLPPSDPGTLCALRAAGFHSNFLVFGPRTGLFPEILSSRERPSFQLFLIISLLCCLVSSEFGTTPHTQINHVLPRPRTLS